MRSYSTRTSAIFSVKNASIFCWLLFSTPVLAPDSAERAEKFSIEREPGAVVVKADGRLVLRYQLQRPADSKLSVESGCYFHPIVTPGGTVITEVAPSDHPHHRGIFLGWVEMHGKKDADFWGWGEHAPKSERKIVNQSIVTIESGFTAQNAWLAEGEPLVTETLRCIVHPASSAHVVDLLYTLKAEAELTLSRWAFSGFCVRTRQDGQLQVESPDGPVKLPNPSHLKPESDWPAAKWYDYTLTLPENKVVGVAIIDHPKNLPSLWHNHREIRMLNPCIVALGPVSLKATQPLVLRYRVVVHDGAASPQLLNRLAAEWRQD